MSYPNCELALRPARSDSFSFSSPSLATLPKTHPWVGVSVLGDVALIVGALFLSFWVRFRSGWVPFATERVWLYQYAGLFTIGTILLILSFNARGLYSGRNLLRYRNVAAIILKGCTSGFIIYLGLALTLDIRPPISRVYAASAYVTCVGVLLSWRWLFHQFLQRESVAQNLRQRVLMAGWCTDAGRLSEAIAKDPSGPYEVVGCVPSPLDRCQSEPPEDKQSLGTYLQLPRILREHRIDILVLTDLQAEMSDIIALSQLCEREFVQFKVLPSFFQIFVSGLHLETISGVPILGVAELPLDRLGARVAKKALDLCGALVGLVLSIPIITLCSILVYLEAPGPVFYHQVRMGRKGRHFKIYKIRSMRLDAELDGPRWAEKNDPRRLKIGALMREWNLDELPQFWNVLKGDMSLVGPRPERPELIERFKHEIPYYNARHASKPGITGWAQVHGLRGNTSLTERIRYDLYYLENWSVWLDCQILFKTFLKRENAY
jgi:exopolysaccharide biosynthesis polyprenyl glycosylphosphotransferase